MNPEWATPLAVFIAGGITSFHCLGMCGPLACLASGGTGKPGVSLAGVGAYHAGRLAAYAALGALAGALGAPVSAWFERPFVRALPWAFVLIFALVLLGWEKKIRLPQKAEVVLLRALAFFRGRGGFLLGLGTPLLPCGPLYLVLAAMLLSGSAWRGAALMACFASGTAVLLLGLQVNWGWLQGRFGPERLRFIQRSMAGMALLVMVWRAAHPLPLFGHESACPFCP